MTAQPATPHTDGLSDRALLEGYVAAPSRLSYLLGLAPHDLRRLWTILPQRCKSPLIVSAPLPVAHELIDRLTYRV